MSITRFAIGVGLMCKPPRPGVSKTRLAASIGPHAAARLSEAFLRDCADTVLSAGRMTALQPTAFYRPHDAEGEMRAILGTRWPVRYADAGDLGATMLGIVEQLLIDTPDGSIIMGSDVPLMEPRSIVDAAHGLQETTTDVVIIPSADGGYCLIGVKSRDVAARLFTGMIWSTSDVLHETMLRIRDHGLRCKLLEPQRDVDDLHDLNRLRRALAMRAEAAVHTRRALSALSSRSPAQGEPPR